MKKSNFSLYRSVDHVLIRLLEIDSLYALFGDVFALPISWPLQRSEFATFAWIHVGNTNLEFWASASNSDLPPEGQPPLVHGLALDPADLSSSVAQLAELGVRCKEPRSYETKDENGALVTNFTNSVVLDVSSESCCIFFCAWDKNGTIFPWKEKLSVVQRRTREQEALRQCAGGPLGLVGLSEIQITVPDLDQATEKWRALTGSDTNPMALTQDIALRLVSGKCHVIQGLTFAVRSLPAARTFLADRGLLGNSSPDELALSSQASSGLNFRFVEARGK
jgi:hypothetical protein